MTRRIRLVSQIVFFVVFLTLLVQTEYRMKDTLDQPVRFFLEIDPLLTLATVIAVEGFFLFAVGIGLALLLVIAGGKLAQAFSRKPLFAAIPVVMLIALLMYPLAPWLTEMPFGIWWVLVAVFAFALVQIALSWLQNKEIAELAAQRYIPVTFLIILLIWGIAQYGISKFGIEKSLPIPMTLGIVTVLATLVLGRVFCGWLCPMGTLHHLVGWLKRDKKPVLLEKNLYRPSQRWKYIILITFLAAAVVGYQVVGLVDPISLLIRSFSIVVTPVVNQVANAAKHLGLSTGDGVASDTTREAYKLIEFPNFLSYNEPHFMGALLIGGLFIFLLALNLRRPRYWCRSLCPLGALLGSVSRNSFYRLEIDKEACINCGRCHHHCQGACDPEHRESWRPAECFVCFHCVDECPVDALSFRFGAVRKETKGIDLKRRRAFGAVAAALVAVPVLRATEQYKLRGYPFGGSAEPGDLNPKLIRPPGALPEKEFLQRCVRCGECMKVCKQNALHPATLEAGPEGMWTPILVPQLGYCEYECTLCGQVCPTGAIQRLEFEAKKAVSIGTAFIDVNRCLPFAFNRFCEVCQEVCPTSPKAIWLTQVEDEDRMDRSTKEVESSAGLDFSAGGEWTSATEFKEEDEESGPLTISIDDEGEVRKFTQPRIDTDLCIGCGACEYFCNVVDEPAIYVTSIGETRNPQNRLKLKGSLKLGS